MKGRSHRSIAGRHRSKIKINRKKISLLVLLVILLAILIKGLSGSLFFRPKDRLNLVFYGQKTVVFSLGVKDGVNYYLPFAADVKVNVPGAYGYYRIGALGKLASLEKKPELFKETFSAASSSFVDYYFYPKSPVVYFGGDISEADFSLPKFSQFFSYRSNGSFWDRVYLMFYWLGKRKGDFLRVNSYTDIVDSDDVFSDVEFFKKYQGHLYRKSYRDERRTVQIIYTKSYSSAVKIGRVIEGNGIRVVDLSLGNDRVKQDCRVVDSSVNFSQTAVSLADFFGCRLVRGKTEVSDIVLVLGDKESDWLISQN